MNWVWGTIIGLILIILTIWIIIKVVKKIIKIAFSILVIIILLSTVAYVIGDYSYNQLDKELNEAGYLIYEQDNIKFGYFTKSLNSTDPFYSYNEGEDLDDAMVYNTEGLIFLTINDEFILNLNKSIIINNNTTNPNNTIKEIKVKNETSRTLIMNKIWQNIDSKTLLDKELVKHYDLTPDNSIEWIVPLTPEFVLNYIKREEK